MLKRTKIYGSVGMALVVLTLLCLSLSSCSSEDAEHIGAKSKVAPLAFNIVTDDYADKGKTRGTPSEELEASIGLYAYVYEESDYWDNGNGTPPNFMINEEVQNAGSYWLTVNAFDVDNMTGEIDGFTGQATTPYMRFFAYYPYGLDPEVLEVSDENHDNAPIMVYTVPDEVEEQIDLLAGGCLDDEGHTKVFDTKKQATAHTANAQNEEVTITMSHLLTAIKFQIGECVETGRIKKITVTNVLGKNQYTLQRDAEDYYYEGWDVRNWGEDWDDDFRDFSIDLNKQIKLTQKNAGGDVVPQEVTDKTEWLMMIPQYLSDESEIQMIYNSGGTDHLLTAEVHNFEWAQGKMVTYTLNINSLQRLTVKSTVIPWGEGLRFQDGQPTNATTLDVGADFVEWDPTDSDIASDDPRD